jgi:hypothetical protein
MGWKELTFLGFDYRAAAVKTTLRAGAMGQHGLAAVGTGAPLRLGEMIMGAPLIFHSLRGSSFRYWHY